MLRVLGSAKQLCDGLTRRDLLQVGGSTFGGLGLAGLLQNDASAATALERGSEYGFGKAKNCIVLFLYGSPSQLETFDMKPNAPREIHRHCPDPPKPHSQAGHPLLQTPIYRHTTWLNLAKCRNAHRPRRVR